jgi:hypothetical protein
MVVHREYAAHDIFIDLDAEGIRDLLGDTDATESGIAALHLDDRHNELGRWTFWARLPPHG